ncbi:MAG TPA: hypothetical protein VII32_12660, partial [Thermoanaerobaculia bacterium]
TVIVVPRGTHGTLTPQVFQKRLRPGFVLAVMNFAVRPIGAGRSLVTTETRVFANSVAVRRGFAAYWRVIYPGSALIRITWLRAIERRATQKTGSLTVLHRRTACVLKTNRTTSSGYGVCGAATTRRFGTSGSTTAAIFTK